MKLRLGINPGKSLLIADGVREGRERVYLFLNQLSVNCYCDCEMGSV